jgi:hypothetical protein
VVVLQLQPFSLYTHDMAPPDQHTRSRRLGPKSASSVAHTIFISPQRPLHRTFHSPRRNGYKQSNDSSTKLLLQEHHVDPLRHPINLRLILRGHVCLSPALLDQSRRRMARRNSF